MKGYLGTLAAVKRSQAFELDIILLSPDQSARMSCAASEVLHVDLASAANNS